MKGEGAQKRRRFFAAARATEYGGFGLFSRWLSERQIMNEHPRARAPPQPLHFLPTPCRPRRTFPRPPPLLPPPSPPPLPPLLPPPGSHPRCQQVGARGCHRHNLARPGTTSIVLVIHVILDAARYARPIRIANIASYATDRASNA